MTEQAMFEIGADQMGKVPITLFLKPGTLKLADGRLSFVRRTGNSTVVDAPIGEFHSVSKNAFGITIWHGPTKYRFVIGQKDRIGASSSIPLVAAASIPGAINDMRNAKQDAEELVRVLTPLVGPAPTP